MNSNLYTAVIYAPTEKETSSRKCEDWDDGICNP